MLKYVELETTHNHRGPAWITRVTASRSGATIYFHGRALKRRRGVCTNHFDPATGDAYWVSGVKRRGTNRHWAGAGRIAIEASAVAEFLALRGETKLDPAHYEVVADPPPCDAAQLHARENPPPEPAR